MSQSLSAVYLRAVFSTKERRRYFQNPSLRFELHSFLGGISRQLRRSSIITGGTEDHIHQLVRFGRTITQADWIKEIKRVSNLWIKQRESQLHHFAWQAGYGLFSVSPGDSNAVKNYIASLEEHHQRNTFQDEFRLLLQQHGLEWDEHYVWD